MKRNYMKTLLMAAGLLVGVASALAQTTTWTFVNNQSTWSNATLNGGKQYNEQVTEVNAGGVTFTGTNGFVATAKGLGFNAIGSTNDENISIVVPVGYKAQVSIYTSNNRTVIGVFGETSTTYNASWASSTKEFDNANGASDVILYLYCNQNPGGNEQNKAPFLEEIKLINMANTSAYPWTANAVATINDTKTTLKVYSSTDDVMESSEYTINVDKAIKYGEDYYALNDNRFSSNIFSTTQTMGNEAATFDFNYEKISDVVFYGEVEDIYTSGARISKQENISALSNAEGIALQGDGGYLVLQFNVPEDGYYNFMLGMNNTNNRERGFNYAIDSTDVSETITVPAFTPYVHKINTVYLTAGKHTLQLNLTYSLTPIFDYMLITAYYPVNITVIKQYGDKTDTLVTQQLVKGDSYSYSYPKFFIDGTTLYKYTSSDDPNADRTYWNSSLSNIQEDATYTLTYTAMNGECVYFSEGEDVEGAKVYTTNTWAPRSSNGATGVLDSLILTTLEPGLYDVTARVIGKNGGNMTISASSTTILEQQTYTAGTETTSSTIELTENTDIIAKGGYYTTSDNGYGFDYIYIMKAAVQVTMTEAKYATFYTGGSALDFTDTGLEAYYITGVNGKTLVQTPVTVVPAYTAVLLYGNAGTYSVPKVSTVSPSEVNYDNMLFGSDDGLTAPANSYVLQNQDGKIGFYKVTVGGALDVPAGKAYLQLPNENQAKALYFNDNATAIETVSALASDAVEGIYTIGGTKVSGLQKGINIVKMQNGETKKVIVK